MLLRSGYDHRAFSTERYQIIDVIIRRDRYIHVLTDHCQHVHAARARSSAHWSSIAPLNLKLEADRYAAGRLTEYTDH